MKDHEKLELVSELVGIARIAHGTEQLRDRIAYALGGVFSELDEATARAERAEAELKAAREQEPVAWRVRGQLFRFNSDAVLFHSMNTVCGGVVEKLYASPIPAPAAQVPQNATCKHPLQVPAEWREVLSGLVAIAEKKGKKQGSPNHCHQRPGIWDDDNGPALSGKPCAECAMYDKARALIQQSEVKS